MAKKKKTKRPTPQAFKAAREASLGNEWYKLRSKHGRDKLFASPQLLWEAACEYFDLVDKTPWHQSKAMSVSNGSNSGSQIILKKVPVKQPYTMQGLCRYLDCDTSYFRVFKATNKNKSEDFLTVIAKIEETVYEQKFSGAASGFFNNNIIARDLGLVDKVDKTSGGAPIQPPVIQVFKEGAPPLNDSETKMEK